VANGDFIKNDLPKWSYIGLTPPEGKGGYSSEKRQLAK
jgi:hypothetical protein